MANATYDYAGKPWVFTANLGAAEGDDLKGFVTPFPLRIDHLSIFANVASTAVTTASQVMMEIAGSDCWTAATVTVAVATTQQTATYSGANFHYNTAAAGEVIHFNLDQIYSTGTTVGDISVTLTCIGE